MNQNYKEEIALRDKAISLLEEEISAKNELIKIQKAQIKQLEEYHAKLITMMNGFFDTLK